MGRHPVWPTPFFIDMQQLSIRGVTKAYEGQRVLHDVQFEAQRGRILGFLGPNGAGKSTTMKIIMGYLEADSGQVLLEDWDSRENPIAFRRHLGYLPEQNPLYTDMYVREFLAFMAGLYKVPAGQRKDRIQYLLEACGLLPEAHKKIQQLSKGYKQRVGLAKALLHDPAVVLLDEPTTGLDPNQLLAIRQLIQEVAKDKIVVLSTHIMQEVEALCDDVVILSAGRVVAKSTLDELTTARGMEQVELELEQPFAGAIGEGPWQRVTGAGTQRLLFEGDNRHALQTAVLAFIQREALAVRRLQVRRDSLEDVFYNLTQGKNARATLEGNQ
ncbi:gliding motility-associated ABC transporter ATP-binding subunit GldA [Nitritalea halalkaliphila LW7]|uniref:Gliding motility-associated ABC transporter ATP-binding subunit GldA n=1 Tax=Nitritalea halalkaliphila LW7 TaxID=1189621 RepID=I5C2E8_9BACT|nr:ATP-binding cassette domain-containing protein [Nitritalea halalkaliphila]EIM76000.1 gliding motility-associated ABC transporter ATP-binding subunit GldA [Nitritalea halalkaliphila LW7]